MPKPITIKDFKKEKRLFQRRLIVAAVFITVLTLLLISRLFYLQIIQHNRYATLSKKNQLELLPIEPNRGLIYDRNGILVAKNIPVFSLDILPEHIKNITETISKLQKIIHIDEREINQFYNLLKQHRQSESIPLKLKLSEQDVAKFYVDQFQFPGVTINARMIRSYPFGNTMESVLGYVGRINSNELQHLDNPDNYAASNFIGKIGIEKYYEKQLHGTVGYKQVEVDASGRIIRTLKKIPPIHGYNIYLTVDIKLQKIAMKALGNERGAVIALKPKTGEILALASSPSFNPNLFVEGISSEEFYKLQHSSDMPMYNRAIRGQFPIASTIKPFIALEGLDSGTITPSYTIYDPGWFELPNTKHIYRDWNWKRGGHGTVNVTKAIIVSSDPFFYNLSVLLSIDKVDDILSRFGFGRKTGIDLPNEKSGLVPTPKWKFQHIGQKWFTGDTVNSGIGQGFMLTTPIQLANAVAAIANRGLRYRPHLLSKIKPKALDPVMLNHKKDWNIVIKAMQGVIKSVDPWGTGRIRFGTNPSYTVAAKTGTGQVTSRHDRDEDARSEANIPKKLRNNTLFIAFAPINHPKIAIAVVVENSPIAGTVARKVLDYYLTPPASSLAKMGIKRKQNVYQFTKGEK